jgi:hypothetical protein
MQTSKILQQPIYTQSLQVMRKVTLRQQGESALSALHDSMFGMRERKCLGIPLLLFFPCWLLTIAARRVLFVRICMPLKRPPSVYSRCLRCRVCVYTLSPVQGHGIAINILIKFGIESRKLRVAAARNAKLLFSFTSREQERPKY